MYEEHEIKLSIILHLLFAEIDSNVRIVHVVMHLTCSLDWNLFIVLDVATVVGYYVVSRPFMNLANPRLLNTSHSERLEVVSFPKLLLCIDFEILSGLPIYGQCKMLRAGRFLLL